MLHDVQYLNECINFKILIGRKLCNFTSSYQSPSQSQDQCSAFSNNLEFNIDSIQAKHFFASYHKIL